MGSSGWYYTVDYQPDVNAALQQLRQAVFDRGEYYREEPGPDLALTEEQFLATLGPAPTADDDGQYEYLVEDWRERKARPAPVDPDTALRAQAESGTHSIIDMANGVSDGPRFATVSPLTAEELVGAFGSVTPSPEQVRAWIVRSGGRDSWVGTYVVSYRDGEPHELHFCGFSGD